VNAIREQEETQIVARLAAVRGRIAEAARRAGRAPEEVTLVAVTKTVGVDEIAALARSGVADFGENRVDALLAKRAEAEKRGVRARWHMIGRLQTNKLRRVLPATDALHSLDRVALLGALAKELSGPGPRLPAFIEVNVAGEAAKAGFDEQGLWAALEAARAVPRLELRGLMTMAPLSGVSEASRPIFRRLKELRDEARDRRYPLGLDLSMGMTQDYVVAVEEGATLVRVGSALFSDRSQETCRT
jgi:pyridoxal phosphate enzyme (YggS family)